jgi:hypothetical protein
MRESILASPPNRAARPTAIRLAEVENAVLDVLDARGIRPGDKVFVGDIETAMDSRGYPGKWVKRAVESLIRKDWLRHSGASYLEPASPPSPADGVPKVARTSQRRPSRRQARQKRRRTALFGP